MKQSTWFVVFLVAAVGTACVTRSKHTADVNKWRGDLEEQSRLRKKSEDDLARKEAERAALEKQKNAELAALEKQKKDEFDAAKKKFDEMRADYDTNLQASKSEIEALRKYRKRIEKSLVQFRKLQEAFRKMIGAGEIRIYRRRGRIMVALPSSVLFPSGSASLSSAGRRALTKVSRVLAKVPDRRFLVAGHTDNVPIGTAKFDDNWHLSTVRALGVTRFLISKGVSAEALAAAGYGEFDPLRPNTSRARRRVNRRIEIILMPNIDELPGIPDTK